MIRIAPNSFQAGSHSVSHRNQFRGPARPVQAFLEPGCHPGRAFRVCAEGIHIHQGFQVFQVLLYIHA